MSALLSQKAASSLHGVQRNMGLRWCNTPLPSALLHADYLLFFFVSFAFFVVNKCSICNYAVLLNRFVTPDSPAN